MFTSIGSIIMLSLSTFIIVGAGAWLIRFLSLAKERKIKVAQERNKELEIWRLNKIVE